MKRVIHPLAGVIAIVTIVTFWLSTVLSELFGSAATVTAVKTAIPWGFLLLIPALAATGGTGFALSKGQRQGLVGAKLKRMPFIAANGLLVLVPSALFLASKARAGEFDTAFFAVQALELVAGAINITLLAMSMRDGLNLTRWRRRSFLRPTPTFSTSLIGRDQAAKDTASFHLKKPEGFTFTAGQSVYLTLPNQASSDSKGRIRTFSIASAPHEPHLVITSRLSVSGFKQALASLPAGGAVEIEGPYGDLILDEDSLRPAVFLAGGIGITPFRSMILDALKRQDSRRIHLFYSNRNVEDAAFLDELVELAGRNPRLELIATLTDEGPDNPGWNGERGYITTDMIMRYVGDLAAPIYHIAGPPQMVAAMKVVLKKSGVKDEDIRAEAFTGY